MSGIVLPTAHSLLGWYSVKDYGAKGDGTTNDTAAIQAAIDAFAAGPVTAAGSASPTRPSPAARQPA